VTVTEPRVTDAPPRAHAPARGLRSGVVVLAFVVAAVAARSAHAYFLVDACLEAGGRYLTDPARCEFAGAVVRPLAELPRRPGWWLLVLGPAGAVGALVFGIGRVLTRRAA
jgi:hypothetical protein